MTVLNLIMAETLEQFSADIDKELSKGVDKKLAMVNVLRKFIKESKKVRFEGDGYSDNWVKDAKKRGLPNVTDTPRALDAYLDKRSVKLYQDFNVLSKLELDARNEIKLENYIM
jgi:glutamine synthetase